MDYGPLNNKRTAGVFLLSGGVIWIISMIISEAVYPGYSINSNYISDLGVGPWPADVIFNLATIIFGICVLAGAIILIKTNSKELFLYGLAIAGLGVFFVGIFPESTGLPHYLSAGTAFLMGSISAVAAAGRLKKPFCFFSAIMGITGLIALIALQIRIYGEIGPGGMERLIAYPLVLWIITYGSYLLNEVKAGQKYE
ncbi:MAG: DUF998 domain-containing protein [Methanomicrobiaceae archaeon]|nr:DUF998 domain-containing protein [Methanomicrobiaceae archaeon]